MIQDAIVDCSNCQKQWLCCRAVRAELEADEVDKYTTDMALRERADVKVLAQHGGHCVYFDPFSRKCKIWETRPKVCRKYDCAADEERAAEIVAKGLTPLPSADQNFRVAVSVAILEDKDKRRVSPMMLYSKAGPTACETFEVKGNGRELIERVQKMVEKQIREQLGTSFLENECEASNTSATRHPLR